MQLLLNRLYQNFVKCFFSGLWSWLKRLLLQLVVIAVCWIKLFQFALSVAFSLILELHTTWCWLYNLIQILKGICGAWIIRVHAPRIELHLLLHLLLLVAQKQLLLLFAHNQILQGVHWSLLFFGTPAASLRSPSLCRFWAGPVTASLILKIDHWLSHYILIFSFSNFEGKLSVHKSFLGSWINLRLLCFKIDWCFSHWFWGYFIYLLRIFLSLHF